ncbi:hypothetical protein [Mycolicibacterium tusciae]|uniref:hypothetical protein n=1 Tax=Mycolicibacterium tusciae TaxID=75922 RepID=UPI001A980D69|nr:hypothetical protein [Mycolicibacterium tusciae]
MRYRINRPIAGRKGVRVIALDGGARAIIERVSPQSRAHARFLSVVLVVSAHEEDVSDLPSALRA